MRMQIPLTIHTTTYNLAGLHTGNVMLYVTQLSVNYCSLKKLRIFELCSLKPEELFLSADTVFIHGKETRERLLHIGNRQVYSILELY